MGGRQDLYGQGCMKRSQSIFRRQGEISGNLHSLRASKRYMVGLRVECVMVRGVGGCACYPCRTALHPAATPKATPSSTTTPLPVSPYQHIAYCSLYTPILTRYLGMTWLGTLDGKMQAPQRVLWPCLKALKPGSRLGPGINRIPFSIAQEHLSFP